MSEPARRNVRLAGREVEASSATRTLYEAFRSVIDRSIAFAALLVLSPILVVAAFFVGRDGGPVLFVQDRIGRNARPYKVFKLRTMVVDADRLLDPGGRPIGRRITRVGDVLRKSSIDELPQLWNVVRGEMALIGPRPILPHMVEYMTQRERERFCLRPGLTGLAQVKGRNFLKWSRRFHYDVIYVRRHGLKLDLWIVWRTIQIVLRQDGVASDRNSQVVDDITTRTKTGTEES